MLFLPSLNPRDDPLTIRVDFLGSLTVEFDHDLCVESFSSFFSQNTENFGIKVFLKLCVVVVSIRHFKSAMDEEREEGQEPCGRIGAIDANLWKIENNDIPSF